MNKTMWSAAGACALLAASFSFNASAAGLAPVHDAGVASYVSGGVGDGEAQRFKAESAHYPLTVELLERAGARDEYTADAHVRIVDRAGRVVLDQKADGPFMLVRLPAGDYRVSAALDGERLAERAVKVSEQGHAKAVFVFGAHAG
jgi:hypothetical protein